MTITDEAFSLPSNIALTASKYGIGRNHIREWNLIRGRLYATDGTGNPVYSPDQIQYLLTRKTLSAGPTGVILPHMLEHLQLHYENLRGMKRVVTVRNLVFELLREFPNNLGTLTVKNCYSCIWRWAQKMGYVYRRITHVAQYNRNDPEVMAQFTQYVNESIKLGKYDSSCVVNIDETNVYFDMVGSYTLEKRGSKTVSILSTKSSNRCTVILGCAMDGTKLPPFLVFKGVPGGESSVR